jgi:hypothetical protein
MLVFIWRVIRQNLDEFLFWKFVQDSFLGFGVFHQKLDDRAINLLEAMLRYWRSPNVPRCLT